MEAISGWPVQCERNLAKWCERQGCFSDSIQATLRLLNEPPLTVRSASAPPRGRAHRRSPGTMSLARASNGSGAKRARSRQAQHAYDMLSRTQSWGTVAKLVEVFLDGGILLADACLSSDSGVSRRLDRLREELSRTRAFWLPPYRVALGTHLIVNGGEPEGCVFGALDWVCGITLISVNLLAIACLCDRRGIVALPASKVCRRVLDRANIVSSAVSAGNADVRWVFFNLLAHEHCGENEAAQNYFSDRAREEFFRSLRYWFQMWAGVTKLLDWRELRHWMRLASALCTIVQFAFEYRDRGGES